MKRTEVITKRGPRSKTFDNGDGTFALEVGGGIAHHQKDGAWVDTDTTWKNAITEYTTGEYPGIVKVNPGTRAITILPVGATVPFSLAPYGHNRKAVVGYSPSLITIPALWEGVDLGVRLAPERVVLEFTVTAATHGNAAFTCTGFDAATMPTAHYEGTDGMPILVPVTAQYGVATWDLSGVPVGAVVVTDNG